MKTTAVVFAIVWLVLGIFWMLPLDEPGAAVAAFVLTKLHLNDL